MSTLLCLLLLIAVAPDAPPASVVDTVYVIPEVTVTATRLERSAFEATAHIDVIDGDAARAGGARHLADILQQGSGTFVRRYGAGGLASLSLRGTSPSQTAILLDGRRLSDPQLGQLDLTLLPSSIVERVEVMNGAASPLYGADAIGGAVHLRTRPSRQGTAAQLRAGAGAFGNRTASLELSAAHDRLSLLLSADTETAANDFAYYSRALRRDVLLENADRRRTSFFGSARREGEATDLRLSLLRTSAERGLAGTAASSRHERQWDASTRLWGDVRFGSATTRVKVGGLFQQAEIRYVNRLTDLDQEGSNRVISVDAEVTQNLPGTWIAIAGAEGATARAFHPQLDRVTENRGAVFVQAAGELGPAMVNAAARGDVYLNPDDAADRIQYGSLNPRIGVSIPVSEALRLRASIARGFRPPTFNDRYWMPGGNPDLRPERGWSRDAGIVLRTRRASIDLTAFYLTTRDQIVWMPESGTIWTPENLSSTRSAGLESSIRYRQPIGESIIGYDLRYSLTHARDRSEDAEGQFLRYVPRDLLRTGISVTRRRITGGISFDYTGRRYINADGSDWLDPFLTVSLRLNATHEIAGARLNAGIIIDNLLDADYAVVAAHPMPPRHLRLFLSIKTIPTKQ